jgi:hypothetical protein
VCLLHPPATGCILYLMRKPEADAWILETLHHISFRTPFETTHLELKKQLVPPKDFAAQLAGLANAARWSPVLVIFGADRSEICGLSPFEVGDWYAELRAVFEYGHAPSILYQNFLLFDGKTVAAFVLETADPPYVIGPGKKGSSREVPWRYGSNTGPAGRHELLRLLIQQTRNPEIEVIGGEIVVGASEQLQCQIEAFVAPASGAPPLMIPNHRIHIVASAPGGEVVTLPLTTSVVPHNPNASSSQLTDSGVVLPFAGYLRFGGFSVHGQLLPLSAPEITADISFLPANFEAPVRFRAHLASRPRDKWKAYWEVTGTP